MRAAFVGLTLLDALLLWAIVRTRGWWVPKAAAIVIVLGFNFLVWSAGGSFSGWATSDPMPVSSTLTSCYVEEPDGDNPGAIFLWVVPDKTSTSNPLAYQASEGEPRAFRFPYTRDLHEQCATAQKQMAGGEGVGVIRSRRKQNGREVPKNRIRFYRLPPVQPPVKGVGG